MPASGRERQFGEGVLSTVLRHCGRLEAVVQITVQVNKSLNTVDAVQHHALELESKPPF
jgi:hypothetical protein